MTLRGGRAAPRRSAVRALFCSCSSPAPFQLLDLFPQLIASQFHGFRGPLDRGFEVTRLGIGGGQRTDDAASHTSSVRRPSSPVRCPLPSRNLSSGEVARTQARLFSIPSSSGLSSGAL